MSSPSDAKPRPRFYSAKLLGVEGPECSIPKCGARGRTTSTGWIERGDLDRWWMEFTCPDHGAVLATGDVWSSLIKEVLNEQGLASSA
jgi:hypothetical protein